jgi:TP901 family phage tail tape measure protein
MANMSIQINFTGNSTKLVAAANNVVKALNRIANAANRSGGGFRGGVKSGGAFLGTLKSLQKGAMGAANTFMNMGNSIRLAAQGMMSVGRAMTFFLTPAIFGILFKATQAAIDFDDALVRVKKTTGATRKELEQIARGLRDLATTTATGVVDLAKMAEQIGQVGVRAPEAIVGLTKVFNMLVSATDITADKVGLSMGKIASAFTIDLNTEEGVKQIEKISSVINRLENDMATTAPEIVEGLLKMAEVGALIDFPPQTGAAFIAALTAAGFSASRAGTALKNMTTYVITNADEISVLMRNTAAYATEQDVLNAINEDAVRVLIDLVTAASMSDDKARTLGATVEALGRRGGVAWSSLAGAVDNFKKALGLADDEWEHSLSLIREYEESLLSTKSQLAVLKNNVTEIALTLGETLLPVLNHLIQVAVPGIRKLTEVFRNMSPQMMKMLVVGLAIAGLAGPMIFFLSQVVFGFSMVWISVGRAAQVLIGFIGLFGKAIALFAPAIGWVVKFLAGWQGLVVAIVAGAAILLLKFTDLGGKVAEFFFSLAAKAQEWGQKLIAEYGGGILAGAAMVLAKVLTAIGNFIAKFLAGASPPELGPLSHIGKWGQTVFDEYLKGFLKADFGILSSVGNIIQGILKNFEIVGNIGEGMQFKFAMEARQALAKLIDRFNETGEVSQEFLDDVTRHLGEAADEVQDLIRLWLEYNRIQQELADLEKQREGVLDTYRQEIQLIAQSNMTAEEKADAIRQAMRARDDELRAIEQQEDILEDEADIVKEQLDTQKAMVAAMQKQDDLQASMIKALDKIASKLGEIGTDFALPSLDGMIPEDFSKQIEEAFEPILTLEERFAQGEKAFDGFFSALKGAPFDQTLFEELRAFDEEAGTDFASTYESLWELGNNLWQIWDTISGVWEKAEEIWDSLFGGLEEGEGFTFEGMGDGLVKLFEDLWENLPLDQWIKDFIGEAIAGLGESLGEIGPAFDNLLSLIKEVGESPEFQKLVNETLPAVLDFLLQFAGFSLGTLFDQVGMVVDAFVWVFNAVVNVMRFLHRLYRAAGVAIGGIIDWFKELPEKIEEFVSKAKEFFSDLWESVKEKAGEIWEGLSETISEAWENIKTIIGEKIAEIVQSILDSPLFQLFAEWGAAVQEAWTAIWTYLKEAVGPLWEDILLILGTIWERIKTFAMEKWAEFVEVITGFWESIKRLVGPIWDGIKNTIAGIWLAIKTTAIGIWEGIKNTLGGIWDAIKAVIGVKINALKERIKQAWESIKNRIKIAWAVIRTVIRTAWDKIKTTVVQKIKDVKKGITDFKDKFVQAGKDLINGIKDGVIAAGKKLIDTVVAKVQEALDAVKKALGIASESKEFMKVGVNSVLGMIVGIEQTGADLGAAMQTTLATDLLGSIPAGLTGPVMAPAAAGAGGVGSITLQFGRDSVRSDRDIDEIVERVKGVLASDAEDAMSMGTPFGGDL